MILDKIERAEKYYYLNKYFKKSFEFIQNNDLKSLDPGKYEIDGENSFLIIAINTGTLEKDDKLEAHRVYIDIQMAIEGSFGIVWKAIEDCNQVLVDYNNEDDAIYFSDKPDFEYTMNPGTFSILMPEDAHYPQAPKEYVKKAILKIKI